MGMDSLDEDQGPDADNVRLDDARAVSSWIRSFGISRADLEKAVAAVGSSTGAVYDYLNRNRRT
jgi:hypothetical protein